MNSSKKDAEKRGKGLDGSLGCSWGYRRNIGTPNAGHRPKEVRSEFTKVKLN